MNTTEAMNLVDVAAGRKEPQPRNPQCVPQESAAPFSFDGFVSGGLTKREYFAGLAMEGLLAQGGFAMVAERAVGYADQLIEELNK